MTEHFYAIRITAVQNKPLARLGWRAGQWVKREMRGGESCPRVKMFEPSLTPELFVQRADAEIAIREALTGGVDFEVVELTATKVS